MPTKTITVTIELDTELPWDIESECEYGNIEAVIVDRLELGHKLEDLMYAMSARREARNRRRPSLDDISY